MNRLYRYALVAAISASALCAQDKPTFDYDRMKQETERARQAMEEAREKMGEMRLNLDLDLEPMLLAQKLARDVTDKVNEKVNEKLNENLRWRFSYDRSRDLYSRGLDALDQRDYDRALRDFDQYYRATADKKDARA